MKKILLCILVFLFVFQCVFAKSGDIVYKGNKNKKQIALTFDDGPGKSTLKILKILEDENIKATFFLFGVAVDRHPNLVKEVYDHGHEIASHTYGHFNFYKYDKDDIEYRIKREITKNEKAIGKVIENYKPSLLRYPHGYTSDLAIQIAKDKGYKIINWTFGCDWELDLTQDQMYKAYKKNIKNGTIFLMHDSWNNENVINFLPDLIKDIKEKGYEIVTVSELIEG